MRNPDTYKGFVYQKKCAFLLLLRELADETGVIAFRMEHPKGDDFDLVYADKLRVYQTKDEDKPDIPECLVKMWRRYTENMQPNEDRHIALGFIFSKEHGTNSCFVDLCEHRMTKQLSGIMETINSIELTERHVRDSTEWERFIKPITVEVFGHDQVETELARNLGLLLLLFGLPRSERDSVAAEFLGRLDEIMQNGRRVPRNEVQEIVSAWFVRYSEHHPMMRRAMCDMFKAKAAQLVASETPLPAISGTGVL